MGNLPGPTFLNLEYIFFLIYRLFQGIGTFFRSLFSGLRGNGSSRLRDFYQGRGATGDGSCNPFLGDVCGGGDGSGSGSFFSDLFGGGDTFGAVTAIGWGLRIFLIILLLFLLFVIVYSFLEWRELEKNSDKHIESLIPKEDTAGKLNARWVKVKELIASNSESDWRFAIMEADAMLEDMTLAMNLPGETLGERLKTVEPSDFLTLQQAWEGHKIRNQIAHQGSEYVLDHRTALAAIRMFEEVFHEFKII
jgi:hypothetical protein